MRVHAWIRGHEWRKEERFSEKERTATAEHDEKKVEEDYNNLIWNRLLEMSNA